MGATSAEQIITGAFDLIGVTQAGEVPSGNDITDAYRRLQNMMGSLAIQPQTIPVVAREVFPLVAFKGGPSNPYTIGLNGDFNTSRPNSLKGAGLLMQVTGAPYPVEIPRAVLTDDGWEAIQIKDLQNSLFTSVYYNATFAVGELGTINLYPVPNTTLNQLVIYRDQQLGKFASLTAQYIVPDGYDDMLEYQLGRRLLGPYHKSFTPEQSALAAETLANVKRANYRLSDLPVDPGMTQNNWRYGFNILTGNM